MLIPINNKYAIGSDSHCWTVCKKRIVEGEIDWKPFKWCVSLSSAVKCLYEEGIRGSKAETIDQLVLDSKKLLSELVSALEPTLEVRVR